MAEAAYELNRFAPREEKTEQKPRIKVVKTRSETSKQMFRMMRTMFVTTLLVVLVCGVLYTQTTITELQTQISQQNQALVDEEAMYAYLTFELESMTTPRAIEQRAAELGLVKMNSNQITYIQVEDGDEIEVQESAFSGIRQQAKGSLQSLMDHLRPE